MLETNATMSVMSTVESLANMEAGAGDTARLILRTDAFRCGNLGDKELSRYRNANTEE